MTATRPPIAMRFVGGAMNDKRAWESTPPENVTYVPPGGPADIYTQVDVDPDGTLIYRKRG